jgi:PAS domain S-box-containing protein
MKSNLQIGSVIFQSALEQTPASIVITDADGKIIYVNKFFSELTGYSLKEALDQNPRILKSGYQPPQFYKKLWNTISSGRIWKGDLLNKRKDGTLYWENASIKPVKNEEGEITHYIAVKQDITEEKEQASKARRRERILNDIEQISKTGGWEFDVEEDQFFWSDHLYEIHGIEKPFNLNHAEKSLECYHPVDRERISKAFEKCLKEGIDYDYTVRFTDFNGNQKWVRTKSHAVKDDNNKILKIIGSVRDVTEEVERESQLTESRERFKTLVNSFDDIVFTLDRKGRHTALYGKWADDMTREGMIGKNAIEIFGEERGKIHLESVQKVLKGIPVVYEWFMENAEGEKEFYQTKLSLLRDDADDTLILGVARNVTIETLYQKELFDTKQRLEFALKATKAGTWDWDLTTDSLIVNDWWANILGYHLNEIEPKIESWERLTHPDDLEKTKKKLDKLRKNESSYFESQIRMLHKKGHWVWINDRGMVVEWDDNEKPVRLAGTHIDITDKVAAQEALQRSEKRYRDLFTRSSDANLIFKDSIIVDCNKAALKILGYKKKNDLIGLDIIDISPYKQPNGEMSETKQVELLQQTKQNKSLRFEWVHQKADGTPIPVEVVITTITNVDNSELLFVVWRDITERKKAEEKVMESLVEKETLLSEIHHRVKNNLAVISGLMQLQLYNTDNEKASQVLNASINRIKSMALIHEQLYQSDNFSDISLDENIQSQAESIRDVFGEETTATVKLNLNLDQVSISINQAMPVGLMVNEILINSFKHAFQGRDKGQVSIILKRENKKVRLNISDNGIGFDASMDKSTTLGRTLIETFASQLSAQMNIHNKKGTEYEIIFEIEDEKGSVVSQKI